MTLDWWITLKGHLFNDFTAVHPECPVSATTKGIYSICSFVVHVAVCYTNFEKNLNYEDEGINILNFFPMFWICIVVLDIN